MTNNIDVYEIRRRNLWMLEGIATTQRILAEKLDIQAQTLGRYGRMDQQVDEATARRIEAKLGKPVGWMDRPNYSMDLTSEEWDLVQKHRSQKA